MPWGNGIHKFTLVIYRGIPEWIIRSLAFGIVGAALVAGLIFLALRSTMSRVQSNLKRTMTWGRNS